MIRKYKCLNCQYIMPKKYAKKLLKYIKNFEGSAHTFYCEDCENDNQSDSNAFSSY